MSTRDEIIASGDSLIREKGFNGFSFYEIAAALGIKNASIHYYFPTKADLGIAVIMSQMERLEEAIESTKSAPPLQKLDAFLGIYVNIKAEGKICLVGSLASDLPTLDERLADSLKLLVANIIAWVAAILKEGKAAGVFKFAATPRTKALMIITNMLASLQLTRLTNESDFSTIKQTILKELKA